MRILIVEDDRKLAAQIQRGLNENSYSTLTVFDGRDGLEAARQGGFDVLVLDVMLPGLDKDYRRARAELYRLAGLNFPTPQRNLSGIRSGSKK